MTEKVTDQGRGTDAMAPVAGCSCVVVSGHLVWKRDYKSELTPHSPTEAQCSSTDG